MVVQETDITKENKQPDAGAPVADLPVKAAFNRYDSAFTRLIAPLVATRYSWLAIEDINPFNFLNKPKPEELNPNFVRWVKPSFKKYLSFNFAALGMGLTFLSVIAFYSKNTAHDIHSLYSEAVGLELGKKKEDVGFLDIYWRSNNAALKVTRKAFFKRSLARLATAAMFFLPWHKARDFDYAPPKYDANANAGVGAMGIYLMGEGFLRDPSYFDVEQNMAATAIHHTNNNMYENIKPQNIQTLLMLQRKQLNKNLSWPAAGSAEGQEQLKLATRIAKLMNKTYRNIPNDEQANFTIGKFNYLVGFGMLNNFPDSLAFVELANKSSDMRDVNNAAAAIKAGQNPQDVFAQFGIDINALQNPAQPAITQPQEEPVQTKFSEAVGKAEKKNITPKTHQEFAAQTSDPNLGI